MTQDVPTQWNNNEQKQTVSIYGYGDINNLTGNQWMLLEKLLRPFEAITKEVPFLWLFWHMIKTMKMYLSKRGDHLSGVGTIRYVLIQTIFIIWK